MSKLNRESGFIRKREYRASERGLILPGDLEPEQLYMGMFAFKPDTACRKYARLLSRVVHIEPDEATGSPKIGFIIHDLNNKPKLEASGIYSLEDGLLDTESLTVDLINRDPLDSTVKLLPPVAGQYFKRYEPRYDESELQQIIIRSAR